MGHGERVHSGQEEDEAQWEAEREVLQRAALQRHTDAMRQRREEAAAAGALARGGKEGTRAGSSSYAVVTCIEAEILGGSNIRHDVSAHARATANSLGTCCANALTPHDDRTQWT